MLLKHKTTQTQTTQTYKTYNKKKKTERLKHKKKEKGKRKFSLIPQTQNFPSLIFDRSSQSNLFTINKKRDQ